MAFVDAKKYEAPGDMLLAYTDGITEARDPQGKLFGERQLLRLVGEHTDGAAASDDRAMLAPKRNL